MKGTIRVPSDKSISHRTVLFAGLARGTSSVRDVLPSADVLASLNAIRLLGAKTALEQGEHGLSGTISGIANRVLQAEGLKIDCGNSGTTARLLLGILSGLNVEAMLTGDASLESRPMERVMDPLRKLGARFESNDGCLPVRVLANDGLHAADIVTRQASAQVKSAVLLAGLAAHGVTRVTEPHQSRNHTELLLPAFGVNTNVSGLTSSVQGPAELSACDVSVPADPSSAAYLAAAASLIPQSELVIEQVALNKTRTGAFEVLKRMGCSLEYANVTSIGAEAVGDICVRFTPGLESTVVGAHEIPSLIDEIPILSLAAAFAHGETVFEQCAELRVKESDRFSAIVDGLSAFGVTAYAQGDDLHIEGASGKPSGFPDHILLPTHHDHRLAMTWYIAGLCTGCDVELDDADCVAVSWPGFFEDVTALVL